MLLDGYADEDQAAAELRCTPRTLRNMDHEPDGGPPYVVIARKRWYPIDDFRKYIRKRTRGAR